MPKFHYKAKEGPSKVVGGLVDAENMDSAIAKITSLGLSPIEIDVATQEEIVVPDSIQPAFRLLKRISLNDIAQMTRGICDLVEAAVPVLKALQIIANQTPNANLKEIVLNMASFVRDGGAF